MIQVIPTASEEQLVLVELVRSVSAMRTETVMQTVKDVLKQPPAIAKEKVGFAPQHSQHILPLDKVVYVLASVLLHAPAPTGIVKK